MAELSQLPYTTYFQYLDFILKNPTEQKIPFRLFGENYPLPDFEVLGEAPVQNEGGQTASEGAIPAPEWKEIAKIQRSGHRFSTIIYSPTNNVLYGMGYGYASGSVGKGFFFEMDLEGNTLNTQDITQPSYSGKLAVANGEFYVERNPTGNNWSKVDFSAGTEEEVVSPPAGALENRLYTFREEKSSSHEYYNAVVTPPNNSVVATTTADGDSSTFNTRSFITCFTQDQQKNIYVCSFDYIHVLKYPTRESTEEETETVVEAVIKRHFFGSGQIHCIKFVSSRLEQFSQPITYVDHSMSKVQTQTIYPMKYISASCHAQPVVDTCFCYEDQLLVDGDRYLEWELLPNTQVQARFFVKKVESVMERMGRME